MQTRRLHVSGLTPAISETDLRARFSVFGNVKDVDGVGKLDGLGQPRRFAYVSLEATPEKHSKCLNILSGATWKGARLRIGEARPDFASQLENERKENERPPKRRNLTRMGGVESKNMGLITVQNAVQRPGWKVTSLSHLVRPMRMRPLHPIERPLNSNASNSHKKKRKKAVPTRARRRKIDPTLYGAIHLTEEMLQADHVFIPHAIEVEPLSQRNMPVQANAAARLPEAVSAQIIQEKEPAKGAFADGYFEKQKQKDLALLASLFNGKDEWDGREDDFADSDHDIPVEYLNKEKDKHQSSEEILSDSERTINNAKKKQAEETGIGEDTPPIATTDLQPTRLKDLFSLGSQEPTSLLAGLELELELDDTVQFDAMPQPVQGSRATQNHGVDIVRSGNERASLQDHKRPLESFQFSSSVPYFFPLESGEVSRGNVKDIFTIAQAQGWKTLLLNQPSSAEVRKQWEANKVALTKDWKHRYREACKKERRSGHVDAIESIT